MNRAENFAARSAVFIARTDAFKSAARTENAFRLAIAWGAYSAGIAAIIARWSRLDIPSLLIIVAGVVVLRAVGNGFLAVWSQREIERIKARLPMPETECMSAAKEPK